MKHYGINGYGIVIGIIAFVLGVYRVVFPEMKLDPRIKEKFQLNYSKAFGYVTIEVGIVAFFTSFERIEAFAKKTIGGVSYFILVVLFIVGPLVWLRLKYIEYKK